MEQIASNRIACQRLLGKTRGRGSRMSHDRAVLLTTPIPKAWSRRMSCDRAPLLITPSRKDYRRPNCNACQTVTALLATRGVAMETPPHAPPQLACLHAQLPFTEINACHVKNGKKTHKLTRRKVVLPVHLRCRTLWAERPVQLSTVLNSSPVST